MPLVLDPQLQACSNLWCNFPSGSKPFVVRGPSALDRSYTHAASTENMYLVLR
jgi:hypothetical protein